MVQTQKPSVIFDFDGVIADSFEVFMESLEEALGRSEPLNPDEIEASRSLTTMEVMRKLGVRKYQLPRLVMRGRRGVLRRMNRVKPHEGMPESIRELATTHRLFILSTNSRAAIINFLDRNDLTRYFEFIRADASMLNKSGALRRLLKREGIKDSCIYIGDETRDIEAAKRVGVRCVAVDWGYSTRESLVSHNPDVIISKPENLLSLHV